MIYIVNLSGGLTSEEALDRSIERYGKASTVALFADTRTEDADLYRFLDDIERYYGIPINRVADGRDVFQVWHDRRLISMGRIAPCSEVLKRQPCDRWVKEHYAGAEYTRVFGYEALEVDRMERLAAELAPVPTWFPLVERPYVDKCHIAAKLESRGIAVPFLYTQGFEHNNCGGGCVKAGQAHWAHLWLTLPERYLLWEAKEEDFREYVAKDVSILKDRRGGEVKPLTLREFRERLERGESYDQHDRGGCGCFAPESQRQTRMDDLLLEVEVVPKRKGARIIPVQAV